jgi:two-component system, NtrC family, sensor kinase
MTNTTQTIKMSLPKSELYLKTEQLLHFRLAFAGVCLVLSITLSLYARTEFDLRLITYLITGAIGYSIAGLILLRINFFSTDRSIKGFNFVLLACDVIALTISIHLTMGIDSDLYVLYLLPILLSSYTFSRIGIYATCFFVSTLYVALLLWENTGTINLMVDASKEGGLAGAYLHRLFGRLLARSTILVSVSFIWGAFCSYISGLAQQVANELRLQLKDNERLVAEVKGQNARERLINSINSALRNTLNLNVILETATQELTAALKCHSCAIVCPNPDFTNALIFQSQYQAEGASAKATTGTTPFSKELLAYLLQNKSTYERNEAGVTVRKTFVFDQPNFISDLEPIHKELDKLVLDTIIVQPIIYGDTSEGIIIIGETAHRYWSSAELDLVKSVAGQVAVAVENAKLVKQLSDTNEDLILKNAHLDSKNLELGAVQAQLVHQEKMASLGRLVAGIAHELNNPINFVHGNLPYLHEYFEDLKKIISTIEAESEADRALVKSLKEKLKYDFVIADLDNILADLNEGTERIRHIIRNLKSFSRLDEAELKEASVNEGLESTLKILSQYYGRDKIDARLNLANLPPVLCYPGQLNQVWMNLLSNAAEAVSGATDPHVSIQTSLDDDKVLISIEDNGSGIKKDAENKIFEPFFTTKPVGQGTGLGLSICHSIIARHGGKIWFESANGSGTIFKVLIPIQASKPLATP